MIKYFTSLAQEFSNDFYSRFRVGETLFLQEYYFPPHEVGYIYKKGNKYTDIQIFKKKRKIEEKTS